MDIKRLFKLESGINIIIQITPFERLALSFVTGNVCEQTRRFLNLKHIFEQLNPMIALYTSKHIRSSEGCIIVIHCDAEFRQRISELCK